MNIEKNNYNWQDKVILIVEDEELNFRLFYEILRKTKVGIIRALNGVEAVNICKNNNNIDLVLMDIKMPEMNGLEATKIIKKFRMNLPIIAQSAYSFTNGYQESKDAGCCGFIEKPIRSNLFLSLVDEYISK